jgi:WD40 repeat protein
LWDTSTGQQRALSGHPDVVRCVNWSRDGKTLASSSEDKTIKLWSAATGEEQATLKEQTQVWSVVFSPDGKTLASASGGVDKNGQALPVGEVKLWNVFTKRERATLTGRKSLVNAVAFSPDGKVLASGGEDRLIHLWDVETGLERATLKGHVGAVDSVCFSPDGKTLASYGGDGTIKLWDVPVSLRLSPAPRR